MLGDWTADTDSCEPTSRTQETTSGGQHAQIVLRKSERSTGDVLPRLQQERRAGLAVSLEMVIDAAGWDGDGFHGVTELIAAETAAAATVAAAAAPPSVR